jgi:hypothetical protein
MYAVMALIRIGQMLYQVYTKLIIGHITMQTVKDVSKIVYPTV